MATLSWLCSTLNSGEIQREKKRKKVVSNIYQYKKLPFFQIVSKLYNRLQEDLVHENKNPGIKSCAANILCCMRLKLFPE
jgi:hypothetical protein